MIDTIHGITGNRHNVAELPNVDFLTFEVAGRWGAMAFVERFPASIQGMGEDEQQALKEAVQYFKDARDETTHGKTLEVMCPEYWAFLKRNAELIKSTRG